MNGYQLTFFTQQDHRHHDKQVGHWLLELAREMGIRGATMIAATEGIGHHGRFHSAHFFDLADQPLEIVMAVSEADSDRVFTKLREEGVKLFYVKAPIQFGVLGEE
jgi:PII-like signaling protein